MTAYCFFDVREVLDPAILEAYTRKVLDTVKHYQGRYRVMGGTCDVIEGEWQPAFPVLIEFPNLSLARNWYYSEEYKELKALRLAGSRCDAVLMESGPNDFIEDEH